MIPLNFGTILMSVGILQFTVIPLIADLNHSHALNSAWPAHARFHVVTQVSGSTAIGFVALYCLWSGRFAPSVGICIAMMLALATLGGFFVSALCARTYGGAISANARTGLTTTGRIDGNVANFSVALALLITGRLIA